MLIADYGHFAQYTDEGYLLYKNEEGQDWNALQMGTAETPGVVTLGPRGEFISSIHKFWLLVSVDGIVTNIDVNPSTLVPNDCTILGIDEAEISDVKEGQRYFNWTFSDVVPIITGSNVDYERDRRIDAGFLFGGVLYQSRPEDRENISGASTAALAAMMGGVAQGDLRWHGGSTDFEWIDADNNRHPMDAYTMFELGKTALAHKRNHIFAANDLKSLDPIPRDYKDDAHWVNYVGRGT